MSDKAEKERDRLKREIDDLNSTVRMANATTKRRGEERDQLRSELEEALSNYRGEITRRQKNDWENIKREDKLRSEIKELRAENERLTKALNKCSEDEILAQTPIQRLEAENVRLMGALDGAKKEITAAVNVWECIRAGEKLAQNIVKEREAAGVLMGLKIAKQSLAAGDRLCGDCGGSHSHGEPCYPKDHPSETFNCPPPCPVCFKLHRGECEKGEKE